MYFCDNCGSPVSDNSHYCPNCGAPIIIRSGSMPKRRRRDGTEFNPWVILALVVIGAGLWLWYYRSSHNRATTPPQPATTIIVADSATTPKPTVTDSTRAIIPIDTSDTTATLDEPLDTFPADLQPEIW